MNQPTRNRYEVVIGLEAHAQLRTRSKAFCGCSTGFGAAPNSHTCPVCLGMPGVLPLVNREMVTLGLRAALAAGCAINPVSVWARKNYFYPDLPKGYQITQHRHPLAQRGRLSFDTPDGERTVGIARIHLEEDAGKSLHSETVRRSLLDFNRCGVPLLEIVSEPDLHSEDDAAVYLKTLHGLLKALKICDGNMEQGSFRCDANISLRPTGVKTLGVRVEIKNINSFRFIRQALAFEKKRQAALLDRGETIAAETRLFDSSQGITLPMRGKEQEPDYRYFPEPDLPPLMVDPAWIEQERQNLPELPRARTRRLQDQYGLPHVEASWLSADSDRADVFEQAARLSAAPRKIAHWMFHLLGRQQDGESITASMVRPEHLADLARLTMDGTLSETMAKEVLSNVQATGKGPMQLVREQGLQQVSDALTLKTIIDQVLLQMPGEIQKYREGKKALLGYFVGEVMRATHNRGDAKRIEELLLQQLDRQDAPMD